MTIPHRTFTAIACAVAFSIACCAATAAPGDSEPPSRAASDPDYAAGRKAIDAKDWAKAIELFNKVALNDPSNADAQNWLGYAYRNSGNFEQAFKRYEQALKLNPKHRGAHEYIGEAYLLTNNLPKAEEHLAALDKLCFFPCEEYTELKEKVAEYKKKTGASAR